MSASKTDNSERPKPNESKAWTNAGKAEDLLRNHGLWGSNNVKATPEVLKVMFGKGGVLRLLRDAWLTDDKISKFNPMVKSLLGYYNTLKVDIILESFEKVSEEEKGIKDDIDKLRTGVNDLYKSIDNVINDIDSVISNSGINNSLEQNGNLFIEKIEKLKDKATKWYNSTVDNMVRMKNKEEINAREYKKKGIDVLKKFAENVIKNTGASGGVDIYKVDYEKVFNEIKEWVLKWEKSMENSSRLGEESKKKFNEKSIGQNCEDIRNKINSIFQLVKNINRKARKANISLENSTESLRIFCQNCNKEGDKYYKGKQTSWYSFKTNKVKKEASRILSIIQV